MPPPLVQNLHRTLSKTTTNLSKEGIQCFQVISGNEVEKEDEASNTQRSRGTSAYVLTCLKKQSSSTVGQSVAIEDDFDFYYYNSKEFSDHIFPISTVQMSVYGDGVITIKLFWKNFGFFENRVTMRGNRDIEKIPWVNKEGEEVPFATFLLKDKNEKFCQKTELTSWNLGAYGNQSHIQCSLGEGQPPLIWREFKFTNQASRQ
ncbi:hypothetical protein WEN_01560 [Mycoplasma wenyonii str. Massachusetts]|uniref:Uncharacterized protein n=1 Tax=Mycoplasma wenyonii (strain Massachusetts) TaxID=1197325 RepID=I6ZET1_MYCWM|nr:hypothetical protein [Mycoplasma wenyonii]AFN65107.1 hypothetical protein WEN_01560 [Mycoplasma wenyonii str. Massachusetts]